MQASSAFLRCVFLYFYYAIYTLWNCFYKSVLEELESYQRSTSIEYKPVVLDVKVKSARSGMKIVDAKESSVG